MNDQNHVDDAHDDEIKRPGIAPVGTMIKTSGIVPVGPIIKMSGIVPIGPIKGLILFNQH